MIDQHANEHLAGVVNSIFVFFTFLISLPALAMPMNRGWLKLQGWLVVVCSFFTLILGLFIWFDTLQTRRNLSTIWGQQPSAVQSLLQQRVCEVLGGQLNGSRLTYFLVSMLWISRLCNVHRRSCLPRCKHRCTENGLCGTIRKFCEFLPRSHLHCCFRNCWYRCRPPTLHSHGSQVPCRVGKIQTYRRKERWLLSNSSVAFTSILWRNRIYRCRLTPGAQFQPLSGDV